MTIVAQVSLIVNPAPVAIPFFLLWLDGERINRIEIYGTVLALLGVIMFSIRDVLAGGGDSWDNVVCFDSILLFAGIWLSDARTATSLPPAPLSFYFTSLLVIAGVAIVVFAAPTPPPRLR